MPFALSIFLSAFLLFIVQLMLGKFILPWFGGSPAVWTTCMLFFQILLLGGYAYAHLLNTRLPPRQQARVHLGLLAGSLLVMGGLWCKWGSPILPGEIWRPANSDQPVLGILKLLAVSVGLPFLLLAATSPLLQSWFSVKHAGQQPYRLYALSNAGSIFGLLAYPFLVEPWTGLSTQGLAWGAGYFIFTIVCGVCAWQARGGDVLEITRPDTTLPPATPPRKRDITLWLALPAVASSLLLSVTNKLCQEVAVIPFLWVLPMAIYLASFILCFSGGLFYPRNLVFTVLAAMTLWVTTSGYAGHHSLPVQIFILGLLLFLFCMACHGELARLKPDARHATAFYLMVALGGAMGGVLVALVAPVVFKDYWEFGLTVAAGWIVLGIVFYRDNNSSVHSGSRWFFGGFAFLVCWKIFADGLGFTPLRNVDFYWKNLPAVTLCSAAIVTMVILLLTWRRGVATSKIWPRLLVGVAVVMSVRFLFQQISRTDTHATAAIRNFYGVVRVVTGQSGGNGRAFPFLELKHGEVNHGIQFQDDPLRRQPVSYYSTNSGIELAFRLHARRRGEPAALNIGVMGLGVGTLAAFARPDDAVRFYEINPAVIAYSRGKQPIFTYVRDCPGKVEIISGDARLALTQEIEAGHPAKFDVLVMDAFSGGTIPVHLLTKEAFAIYLAHLRDGNGIIAVNISNHYLDLSGLMSGVAGQSGLSAVVVSSRGNLPDKTPSRWCLLTKDQSFMQLPAVGELRETKPAQPDFLWTDDFSNLFQLLR